MWHAETLPQPPRSCTVALAQSGMKEMPNEEVTVSHSERLKLIINSPSTAAPDMAREKSLYFNFCCVPERTEDMTNVSTFLSFFPSLQAFLMAELEN